MLSRIIVRDFQAVRQADIRLGRLTALVGPSNSGKSAILRALRTVIRNAVSPYFVSAGAKLSEVDLVFEDRDPVSVRLRRGKGLSEYVMSDPFDPPQEYPKAGTSVPEDVRRVLNFPEIEGELLGFAGQFDRPFLVDEPPSYVAKVLGDLTNANVIYEAVREADRRRKEAMGQLKVRHLDLQRLQERAGEFSGLPAQIEAVGSARKRMGAAKQRAAVAVRLAEALSRLEMAGAAAAQARQAVPEVPDTSALQDRAREIEALRDLLDRTETMAAVVVKAREGAERYGAEASEAEAEHQGMLRSLGRCPLCGSEIKEAG